MHNKGLRWKFTVEWPAALGDWLWLMLVVRLAERLDNLTFRKIVVTAAVMLILAGWAQLALPADLAVLLTGDLTLYVDALITLTLLLGQTRVRTAWSLLRHRSGAAIDMASRSIARTYAAARQRRNANAVRRVKPPAPSDEDPAAAWGFALA